MIPEIFRKIYNLVNLGKVSRTKLGFLQLKGSEGELKEDIRIYQQFGFVSFLPRGSEVVYLSIDGDHSESLAIASDLEQARKSIELEAGETAIYAAASDTYIRLKKDGEIVISAGSKLKISGNVEIDGKLDVTGNIKDNSSSQSSTLKNLRDTYNTHSHPENGAPPDQPV
jgi:phage gp45-like